MTANTAAARARMVTEQLRGRDIRDPRVLAAMARVPRDAFVPEAVRHEAYDDHPVPIGHGQTISQPYIVAYMTEALRVEPSHRVLEIGTGCGYQTAVLAELAREVYSVEVIGTLADAARRTLQVLGYDHVQILVGDGHEGWREHAPYDRILVAAAAEAVPPALVAQLADNGTLVIPVGVWHQELRVLQKEGGHLRVLATLAVRFVPLVRR